jgi:hypothetical protein
MTHLSTLALGLSIQHMNPWEQSRFKPNGAIFCLTHINEEVGLRILLILKILLRMRCFDSILIELC